MTDALFIAPGWSQAPVAALVNAVVGQEHCALPPVAVIMNSEPPALLRVIAADECLGPVEEVLQQLPEEGYAIFPGDELHVCRLANFTEAHVIRVGRGARNNLLAEYIECQPGRVTFACEGTPYEIHGEGRHTVNWALCALAVGRICGLADEEISARIARANWPEGHCTRTVQQGFTLLNNTAGGTPGSLRAACEVLRATAARCRIVVLGEAPGLARGPSEARRLGNELVARCGVDRLILCGPWREEIAAGAKEAGLAEANVETAGSWPRALLRAAQFREPGHALLVEDSQVIESTLILAPPALALKVA